MSAMGRFRTLSIRQLRVETGHRAGQTQDAITNASKRADAANMTAVAIQRSALTRFDTVSGPIARGFLTISIITAIKGAARMPLTTAAQYRARADQSPPH